MFYILWIIFDMWKDLNMKQKSEIMKMFIDNGISDLNDIKQQYDNSLQNQFDQGGNLNENNLIYEQNPVDNSLIDFNDKFLYHRGGFADVY